MCILIEPDSISLAYCKIRASDFVRGLLEHNRNILRTNIQCAICLVFPIYNWETAFDTIAYVELISIMMAKRPVYDNSTQVMFLFI